MRLLKQLFFAFLWLVFLFGLGYLGYKLLTPAPPKPTCLSGQGGNNCIPTDLQPISVYGNIQIIPVATSTDHISVLVQVRNSNPDYAAKSFDYDLKLTDNNGSSTDITGSSFIYAGDLKYLAFPNIPAGEPASSFTASFTAQNPVWVKDSDFQKPSTPTLPQNQSTVVSSDHIEVDGQFLNTDAITLSNTTIIALLYDSNNNLIGISQTTQGSAAPGDTKAFTVTFPLILGVNISNTQVFVYPQY